MIHPQSNMGGGLIFPPEQEGSVENRPAPLRVITHNIRYAATDLFDHEQPWRKRLPNIMRQLHHYTALPFNPASTIICLQEVLVEQLQDISANLQSDRLQLTSNGSSKSWAYVGVGRDDGKSAGEFNPIFYREDAWDKLHFETIWLSETPDKVSRGWDGGCNRLCTCLILRSKHKHSTQTIMCLNTHLDNAGLVARRKGAELIINRTRKWREVFKPDHILLTGDLNSSQDEAGGAWQTLNSEDSGFIDVKRLLEHDSDIRRYGDEVTFTGFNGNGDADEVGILDFVHYGLMDNEGVAEARRKLCSLTTVPNLFDDGIRCSDHRAVVVDLLL